MDVLNARPVIARDRLLNRLTNLPPFSPILDRLLASLAREHVSIAEVSDLIEKDTVLAGSLLRMVNSSLYGFLGTINSVRHAVSIVGLARVRNMVLTLSVARIWTHEPQARGWSSARFNLHSAAAATLADLIAQVLPVEYPEGAFTAGLLHDFGKLLIATEFPVEFETISALLEVEEAGIEECEREVAGISHAELSAAALARWNLPLPIQNAVKRHHSPEPFSGGLRPLSHVVQAADRCVNELGFWVLPPTRSVPQSPDHILEELGLGARTTPLLEEFNAEMELVRAFF
jgi:putative nucleotidyltransferase with HDIG domain